MAKKIEQAGKGYAELQFKREFGPAEEDKDSGSEKKSTEEDEEEGDHKEFARKKPKKTKDEIDMEQSLMENYYQLLGLDDITGGATEK